MDISVLEIITLLSEYKVGPSISMQLVDNDNSTDK